MGTPLNYTFPLSERRCNSCSFALKVRRRQALTYCKLHQKVAKPARACLSIFKLRKTAVFLHSCCCGPILRFVPSTPSGPSRALAPRSSAPLGSPPDLALRSSTPLGLLLTLAHLPLMQYSYVSDHVFPCPRRFPLLLAQNSSDHVLFSLSLWLALSHLSQHASR